MLSFDITSLGDWLKAGFIGLAAIALVLGVQMFKEARERKLDKNGFRLAIILVVAGLIVCGMGLYWALAHENNEQKIQAIQASAAQQIKDAKSEAEVSVLKMRDSLKNCRERIEDSLNSKNASILELETLLQSEASPNAQFQALDSIRGNLTAVRDNLTRIIEELHASEANH